MLRLCYYVVEINLLTYLLTFAGLIWFWESRVFTMYTTSVYRVHTLCAFM